jgi:hypothetical protein
VQAPARASNIGNVPFVATFFPGAVLASPQGLYEAVQQPDNNFVIYYLGGGSAQATLATGQNGRGPPNSVSTVFQADGNLVQYLGNQPIWASNSEGKGGTHLYMQDDGNLVIYRDDGTPIWAAKG